MIGVPLFICVIKRTSDFLLKKFKPLVYVVGGFITCSLLPAVVFQHIEGWTLLEAWYFTMQTLFTIGFGDFVLLVSKSNSHKGFGPEKNIIFSNFFLNSTETAILAD